MSELVTSLLWQMKAAGLPTPKTEWKFHPTRRWRFDVAYPDLLVAIEVDGGTWHYGRHNRPAGYQRDCEKLNEALVLGWRVLRVTSVHVHSGEALGWVERALGVGAGDGPRGSDSIAQKPARATPGKRGGRRSGNVGGRDSG